MISTVCPKSLVHLYTATTCIKMDQTSLSLLLLELMELKVFISGLWGKGGARGPKLLVWPGSGGFSTEILPRNKCENCWWRVVRPHFSLVRLFPAFLGGCRCLVLPVPGPARPTVVSTIKNVDE